MKHISVTGIDMSRMLFIFRTEQTYVVVASDGTQKFKIVASRDYIVKTFLKGVCRIAHQTAVEQISVWLCSSGACSVCSALYVSNLLGLQEREMKLRLSVCDIVCFPSVMDSWMI